MRIALVFPPQGHFTAPYLSLPSLKAYLAANGYDDVTQLDENLAAYEHFLSKPRLARSLEAVRERGRLEDLDRLEGLVFSDMERYQTLSELELVGNEVIERVEEAKRVLRTPEAFYDYERYLWAGRTIEQALRLFSAEYAPTRLSAHGFVMRYRIERSAEILAATQDRDENPYIEFFEQETLPRLKALDPDVVGISLTFGSQAIPTFTLARLIKAWKPECHIVVGGGLLAYVGEKLSKVPAVWDVVDSFAMLEGERPLLELCRAVEAGERDLSRVENLIWRDATGEVRTNPHKEPLDIKELPTPDFDGLPLERYFSPELILPLASTRGCYWGKCVFCTLYTVIGPGYRGRTLEQTVDDLRTLSERYGAKHFYLAIEDLPPNMARALPKKIIEAGLDVNWWCDARLEHEVFTEEVCRDLAAAGCRRIAFGYESASERVLEKMCKGVDPTQSLELLQRVRDAGISVTLYAMVGFPTETRDEAHQTLETILANKDLVQEVSVRVFYLDETSEVFKRREEFSIHEIFPDPEADLQVYYDFNTEVGMSRREAREVYLEFTRALRSHFPVFQNTNMLYHELKGHYFLFLCRLGSWEKLKSEVLERDSAAPVSAGDTPRRRAGLESLPLAFDRADLDLRLASIDSATLRPRFQSDLHDEEDRERFDAELEPLAPSPSVLVYDTVSGEVRCLSPEAWALLERCDGTRDTERVVEIFPAEARDDARRALTELAGAQLLAAAPRPAPKKYEFRILPADPKNAFEFEDAADK